MGLHITTWKDLEAKGPPQIPFDKTTRQRQRRCKSLLIGAKAATLAFSAAIFILILACSKWSTDKNCSRSSKTACNVCTTK